MKIVHIDRLMVKHTTEQTTQQTVRMGNWYHAIIILLLL